MNQRLFFACLPLLVLFGCPCWPTSESKTISTSETTYTLLEVEIVSGRASKGEAPKAYRLPIVEGMPRKLPIEFMEGMFLNCEPYKGTCLDLASKRGAVLIERFGSFDPSPADLPVGGTRKVSAPGLSITPLSGEEDYVRPIEGATQVEAVVRVVARCPAEVAMVDYTSSENVSSGIVAIYKSRQRSWTELRAACFSRDHLTLRIPTEAQVKAAAEAGRQQEEERKASLARFEAERKVKAAAAIQRRDDRLASFQAQAADLAQREYPPDLIAGAGLSPLEHLLNPGLASLLRAAGVTGLSFEYDKCPGTPGSTIHKRCETRHTEARLTFRSGHSQTFARKSGFDADRFGELVQGLAVDPKGLLRVSPGRNPGPDPAQTARELTALLEHLVANTCLGPECRALDLPPFEPYGR